MASSLAGDWTVSIGMGQLALASLALLVRINA